MPSDQSAIFFEDLSSPCRKALAALGPSVMARLRGRDVQSIFMLAIEANHQQMLPLLLSGTPAASLPAIVGEALSLAIRVDQIDIVQALADNGLATARHLVLAARESPRVAHGKCVSILLPCLDLESPNGSEELRCLREYCLANPRMSPAAQAIESFTERRELLLAIPAAPSCSGCPRI